jgi:hypothetical protein
MNSLELKQVIQVPYLRNSKTNPVKKNPVIVLRKSSSKHTVDKININQNIVPLPHTKFIYENDDKIYEVDMKEDSQIKNLNKNIEKIKQTIKNIQGSQLEDSKVNLQTGVLIQVGPNIKNESLKVEKIFKDDVTVSNIEKPFNNYNNYNLNLIDSSTNFSGLANCLLCEQIISIQSLNIMENCKHHICVMCCKTFYEDRIELGEVDLKCPNYKCESRIILNNLKNFISLKHFESLEKNKLDYECVERNDVDNMHHNSISAPHSGILDIKKLAISKDFNNKEKNTMIFSLKNLAQKHVLQIGSDEPYMLFNKFKDYFCKACNEPSLYGKLAGKMVKCLNCEKTFCKFCMKNLTSSHFDLSNQNHCKIYFKKRRVNTILTPLQNRQETRMRKFYVKIMIIIFGFLLIMKFLHSKILKIFELIFDILLCGLSRKFKKINYIVNYILLFFNIPIFIIMIFVGNIILPYFPIIHFLVENIKI